MKTKTVLLLFLINIFTVLLAVSAQNVGIQGLAEAPYGKAERTGVIAHPSITEASGIAASYRNRNVLWVVNDGGDVPTLYALLPHGQTLGNFRVSNAANIDWEDLATFRHRDIDYLMIADFGDNDARREFCTLYIVKEPALNDVAPKTTGTLDLVWKIDFQYEDGPRDSEGLAVDIVQKRILILTKRTNPPQLYELPFKEHRAEPRMLARRVTVLKHIPPPTAEDMQDAYGPYRSQPTSMDLSPDGTTLVVLTYKHAYCYQRQNHQQWQDVFAAPPQLIPLPHPNTGELKQREAICIDPRTGALYVTTEQSPAPIYRLNPVSAFKGKG